MNYTANLNKTQIHVWKKKACRGRCIKVICPSSLELTSGSARRFDSQFLLLLPGLCAWNP